MNGDVTCATARFSGRIVDIFNDIQVHIRWMNWKHHQLYPIVRSLSSYFDYWDCDVLNTIHDDCCSTPKSQIDAYIHIDQEIPRVTKIDIKDHKHR